MAHTLWADSQVTQLPHHSGEKDCIAVPGQDEGPGWHLSLTSPDQTPSTQLGSGGRPTDSVPTSSRKPQASRVTGGLQTEGGTEPPKCVGPGRGQGLRGLKGCALNREGHFSAARGWQVRNLEVSTAFFSQGGFLHSWALESAGKGSVSGWTLCLSAFCLGLNSQAPFLQVGGQVSVLTLLLSAPLLHTIPTEREHWKGLESTQSSPLIVQVMRRPKPRGPEMLTRITQTVRGKTRLFLWSQGAAQLPKVPGVGSRQFMFLSPQGTSRSVTRSPSQRTSRKT